MARTTPLRPGPTLPSFVYPPLTDPLWGFRLLRCSSDDVSSTDFAMVAHDLRKMANKYIAVSYACGDAVNVEQMTFNGEPYLITSNAKVALRQLRSLQLTEYIWLDAICIDQGNDDERGHQVRKMGRIYSSARGVAASTGLGTSLQDLQKCISLVGSAQRRQAKRKAASLLERLPYFKRMWIIQELILAKKIFVMNGDFCEDIHDLLKLCEQIYGTVENPERHGQRRSRFELIAQVLWDRTSYRRSRFSLHFSLVEAIAIFAGGKCQDPRDQVYSLIGLAKLQQSTTRDSNRYMPIHRGNVYPVSYSKHSLTVLFDFVNYLWRTSGLGASATAIDKLIDLLPIDWSKQKVKRTLLSAFASVSQDRTKPEVKPCSKTRSSDVYCLSADLVNISTVQSEPFSEAIESLLDRFWVVGDEFTSVEPRLWMATEQPTNTSFLSLRPRRPGETSSQEVHEYVLRQSKVRHEVDTEVTDKITMKASAASNVQSKHALFQPHQILALDPEGPGLGLRLSRVRKIIDFTKYSAEVRVHPMDLLLVALYYRGELANMQDVLCTGRSYLVLKSTFDPSRAADSKSKRTDPVQCTFLLTGKCSTCPVERT